MSPSEPPLNPYESPQEATQPFSPVYQAANIEHFKLLKQFRQQIHALGGFWIFIGSATILAGTGVATMGSEFLDVKDAAVALALIFSTLGLIWLSLGIGACLKQLWAVYLGLGLSYLAVVANLFNLNVCGLIILAVVILQAHRVLGFAKRLRGLGIPLTTRPEQLTMQVAPPPGQWPT